MKRHGKNISTGADAAELPPTQRAGDFPIVGIGASAGGLEALEQFLAQIPAETRAAFVIVQHLDPAHKGNMPELLQRLTPLRVVEVTDLLQVEPGCVYLIPPNCQMSILHGVLHLFPPFEPRGLRLPIDFFFRSLADDLKELSIGVVLSGMGSDGTVGLRAIKEKGGLGLVQDPASAKFDSMPHSAIREGLADVVGSPGELATRIVSLADRFFYPRGEWRKEKDHGSLEKITILLREHTGHDFSMYKKSTLYRRIERRMAIHQIDKIANYVHFLQTNPHETEILFKEFLIGVTCFFRDPHEWEILQQEAIPRILKAHSAGVLRAWSVGCSTGEEAYSLAMVFVEALEQHPPAENVSLQIFATDLDGGAIEVARQGVFPASIAADVSPPRLSRFTCSSTSMPSCRKSSSPCSTSA